MNERHFNTKIEASEKIPTREEVVELLQSAPDGLEPYRRFMASKEAGIKKLTTPQPTISIFYLELFPRISFLLPFLFCCAFFGKKTKNVVPLFSLESNHTLP